MRPPPLPRKRPTSCGRPSNVSSVGHHRVRPQRGRVGLVQLDVGAVRAQQGGDVLLQRALLARRGARGVRDRVEGDELARQRHERVAARRDGVDDALFVRREGHSAVYRIPSERQLRRTRAALAALRARGRARAGARAASASTATVGELGSHQDQNVLVTAPSGRYVLKIANAAFGEAELDLQNRAMVHLAERLPLEVPTPVPCARRARDRPGRARRRDLPAAARDVHRGRRR